MTPAVVHGGCCVIPRSPRQFDGLHNPAIYVGLNEQVFDVSTGSDWYGADQGPYHALAGQVRRSSVLPCPLGAPSVPLFPRVFPEKRLDLKSLKEQTKTEELAARCPEFFSLRLSLEAL